LRSCHCGILFFQVPPSWLAITTFSGTVHSPALLAVFVSKRDDRRPRPFPYPLSCTLHHCSALSYLRGFRGPCYFAVRLSAAKGAPFFYFAKEAPFRECVPLPPYGVLSFPFPRPYPPGSSLLLSFLGLFYLRRSSNGDDLLFFPSALVRIILRSSSEWLPLVRAKRIYFPS